jgi:hypothetical protein
MRRKNQGIKPGRIFRNLFGAILNLSTTTF